MRIQYDFPSKLGILHSDLYLSMSALIHVSLLVHLPAYPLALYVTVAFRFARPL